jgi:hypothetical protein
MLHLTILKAKRNDLTPPKQKFLKDTLRNLKAHLPSPHSDGNLFCLTPVLFGLPCSPLR